MEVDRMPHDFADSKKRSSKKVSHKNALKKTRNSNRRFWIRSLILLIFFLLLIFVLRIALLKVKKEVNQLAERSQNSSKTTVAKKIDPKIGRELLDNQFSFYTILSGKNNYRDWRLLRPNRPQQEDSEFIVVLGSFLEKKAAQSLLQKLPKRQLSLQKVEFQNKIRYRVQSPVITDLSIAQAMQRDLLSKNISATILRRNH